MAGSTSARRLVSKEAATCSGAGRRARTPPRFLLRSDGGAANAEGADQLADSEDALAHDAGAEKWGENVPALF